MESESEPRYESLPERLIREAMEEGGFDDLPGEGKPLPGAGQPDDELWWVRAWVRRAGFRPDSRDRSSRPPAN